MSAYDYELSEPEGPVLGLVVLRVDETVERDLATSFPPAVARLHVTRVQSGIR